MYDKILVPLDGSQRAEAILRHVEELVLRFQARVNRPLLLIRAQA